MSYLALLMICADTESLLLCSIRLGISAVDRRLRSTSSQTRIWNINVYFFVLIKDVLFECQVSFFWKRSRWIYKMHRICTNRNAIIAIVRKLDLIHFIFLVSINCSTERSITVQSAQSCS